jgi:hypothetical protein
MTEQITNLKDVFKYVKLEPFTNDFTDLKARGGLYHRINGKSTATGKTKDLTDEDKQQLKAGLLDFVAGINKVIEEIPDAK